MGRVFSPMLSTHKEFDLNTCGKELFKGQIICNKLNQVIWQWKQSLDKWLRSLDIFVDKQYTDKFC